MSENTGKLFIYSIIGFFAGLYFFYKGFQSLKLKRTIENMPTSTIRSLAIGFVELKGIALSYQELLKSKLINNADQIPKEVLRSPFSQKECVYYKYTIERYVRRDKSSYWETVRQGTKGSYLVLKDKTGTVLVNLDKAEIDVPLDKEYNSALGVDPPTAVLNFIKINNIAYEGLFGMNYTMRYREYYIAPGDNLYILGTAGKNPFIKNIINNEDGIMIQKGNNSIYYISEKAEKDIVSSMNWKTFGGIIGGAALSILCLTIILFIVGLL